MITYQIRSFVLTCTSTHLAQSKSCSRKKLLRDQNISRLAVLPGKSRKKKKCLLEIIFLYHKIENSTATHFSWFVEWIGKTYQLLDSLCDVVFNIRCHVYHCSLNLVIQKWYNLKFLSWPKICLAASKMQGFVKRLQWRTLFLFWIFKEQSHAMHYVQAFWWLCPLFYFNLLLSISLSGLQNRSMAYLQDSYALNSSDEKVWKISPHHLRRLWSIISTRSTGVAHCK